MCYDTRNIKLKAGGYMRKVVSIGTQRFERLRTEDCFYVDKTNFIKEWWESKDEVTLITKPRRFGKTLNMDMLNCFFSNRYENRGDLFEGLFIWNDEEYRKLQGTYPVIFLSFADVKQTNFEQAVQKIKHILSELYLRYEFLEEKLTEREKKYYQQVCYEMNDVLAQDALKNLSMLLSSYYKQDVIILLDEYDTPVQEAYMNGYLEEFTGFLRNMFNATFKTNPYMYRAVMTGITRVSKESMFSDLNNLKVVTTTSEEYNTCFGFTEEEVFKALDDFGMSDEKENVKKWYDGFVFGSARDIYNPWSITGFLNEGEYRPYWTSTSSNGLAGRLLQTASVKVKKQMEKLIQGEEIVVDFDEQIVFNQLGKKESAIWSLLMASGYFKAVEIEYEGETKKPYYHLKITNLETRAMFENMFTDWFEGGEFLYSDFVNAIIKGDTEYMNYYMNKVSNETFSYFDVGGGTDTGFDETERFYHGFVLGLIADQRNSYNIKSNRESGFGRYDIMMIPKKDGLPGIIIEFKVKSKMKENSLEDTVQVALKQIKEKNYDAELLAEGITKENIKHYGFAFEGKNVLIDKE